MKYSKIEYYKDFMKAISLFSGAGGMDVGIQNAGFKVVYANELDKNAANTYKLNNPDAVLLEGDINDHIDFFNNINDIDLIFGGPPCQGFSVAGKMDINDPRSQLVFSFMEVVRRVKPQAFIMENVRALARLDKFANFREEIARQAISMGYAISMIVVNAKDFGVPQSRERVFFIGLLNKNQIFEYDFIPFYQKAPTVREVIGNLGLPGSENNPYITQAKITLAKRPILRKSAYAGMLFNGQGRPLNPDSWSSTLPASMGGNRTPIIDEKHLYDGERSWVEYYHDQLMKNTATSIIEVPNFLRRLTITEAQLLQTFPMDYHFSGSQSSMFSQIGNAVPCRLAEVVAKVVKYQLQA